MKMLFQQLLCFCFCNLFAFALRFSTFNIQSGSNVEHNYNLTETARTIDRFHVDFIGLQEVDNRTERHFIDQTMFIAEFNSQRPFRFVHFEKMRNFQNGAYGISILGKTENVRQVFTQHYRNTTAEQCVTQKDGDYCQGFLLVEIPVFLPHRTDVSIYFGTTHLGIGLNGTQQFNEAKEILQWMTKQIITRRKSPFVILMTGDFNSIPTEKRIENLMNSLFDDLWLNESLCKKIIDPNNPDGNTFDSLKPTKRIDYFFFYKSENFPSEIRIDCQIEVLSTLASDHRPVILDFQFSTSTNERFSR